MHASLHCVLLVVLSARRLAKASLIVMPTVAKTVRTMLPLTRTIHFNGSSPSTEYFYGVSDAAVVTSKVGCKDYKTKIANSQSATTPYSGTRQQDVSQELMEGEVVVRDYAAPPTRWHRRYYARGIPQNEVDWYPSHLLSSTTIADNKALTKLYSAIKSQQQQMSGFTFLGELRETIQMIKRPTDALITGLGEYFFTLNKEKRKIRHRTVARKKKALVDISTGLWLEASFGWMPLLNDVKDIAETLARYHVGSKRHTEVRGYGIDSAATYGDGTLDCVGSLRLKYARYTKTDSKVIYTCGLRATDTLPALGSIESLRELAGFNLQDFIPSLYQLVPNSFLLDYFANVGDILEAACTSTANVTWINKSTIRDTTTQVVYTPYWSGLPNTDALNSLKSSPGRVIKSLKSFDRTALSALPIPSLEFSLPGGTNKYWNMAALFAAKSKKTLLF